MDLLHNIVPPKLEGFLQGLTLDEKCRCYRKRGEFGHPICLYPIWHLRWTGDVKKAPFLIDQGLWFKGKDYRRLLLPLNPLYEVSLRTAIQIHHTMEDPQHLPQEWRFLSPAFLGRICPLETPESDQIGILLQATRLASVDDNGLLYTPYSDRWGRQIYLGVQDEVECWIGERWPSTDEKVLARRLEQVDKGGKVLYRARYKEKAPKELDYALCSPNQILGFGASLVPFLQHNDGARAMMGARMMKHALPLLDPEEPLVKTGFGSEVVRAAPYLCSLLEAPIDGEVVEIDCSREGIRIRNAQGQEQTIPLNPRPIRDQAASAFVARPRVKVGQKVKKGDLVADGPAMKEGQLALGRNLLVAYLPFKGWNFEDGIVISETAARKLTSPHVFVIEEEGVDLRPTSRRGFSNGMIRLNARVRGGAAIAEVRIRPPRGSERPLDLELAVQLLRTRSGQDQEISEALRAWQHQLLGAPRVLRAPQDLREGRVIRRDWDPSSGRLQIWIYEEKPAVVGDKLAGRHGNKGVIARILKDEEMPYFEVGGKRRYVEVLLNPLGVVSRMNLGQLLETHWGWVLHERPELQQQYGEVGRPFGDAHIRELQELLKETGLDEQGKIELYDGRTGKPFAQRVVVGYQYLLKLPHLAEEKWQVRGKEGPRALRTEQPAKGKQLHGGQRFGEMEVWALLSHGALYTLWEFLAPKADELLSRRGLAFGEPLPWKHRALPRSLDMLKYLLKGVRVQLELAQAGTDQELPQLEVSLMNDQDVLEESKGEVRNPRGEVDIPEGLYSAEIFGLTREERRQRCGHLVLPEPFFHPLLIDRVWALLPKEFLRKKGLSQKELKELWQGYKRVKQDNKDRVILHHDKQGRIGTRALVAPLEEAGIERSIWERYLMQVVPVIPPAYRPLPPSEVWWSKRAKGLWKAYKEVVTQNEFYKQLNSSDPQLLKERLEMTRRKEGLKRRDLTGLERRVKSLLDLEPNPWEILQKDAQQLHQYLLNKAYKDLHRAVCKLFESLKGEIQGKEGVLREDLLGKRQDFSARAVIVPAPDLAIDECYLPLEILWEWLKEELQVERSTVRDYYKGKPEARTKIKKQIEEFIDKHKVKVLLNRQPTLHKYNILAFTPRVWEEKVIGIPPLICSYYNADFDGDQMAVYLPCSKEAQREARSLTPLNHLFSWANGDPLLHFAQDIVLGIYLSLADSERKRRLAELLNRSLEEIEQVPSDKKKLMTYIGERLLQLKADERAQWLRDLRDLALEAATHSGISLSYFDLEPLLIEKGERQDLLKLAEQGEEMDERLKDHLSRFQGNPLSLIFLSGARGSWEQICQLIAFKGRPLDEEGREIEAPPIMENLWEGLSPFQYFLTAHATRRTMMDKKLLVAQAGDLTRQLVESAYGVRLVSGDCGSKEGIPIPKGKALGRTLAEQAGPYPPGTRVSAEVLQTLKEEGDEWLWVRSPLTCCKPLDQVCEVCYGVHPITAEKPEEGTYIGILGAQSIGERGTQLSMQTFHTGRVGQLKIGEARKLLLNRHEFDELEEFLKGEEGLWDKLFQGKAYQRLDPRHFEVVLRPRFSSKERILLSAREVAGDIERRDPLATASYADAWSTISECALSDICIYTLKDPETGVLLVEPRLLGLKLGEEEELRREGIRWPRGVEARS